MAYSDIKAQPPSSPIDIQTLKRNMRGKYFLPYTKQNSIYERNNSPKRDQLWPRPSVKVQQICVVNIFFRVSTKQNSVYEKDSCPKSDQVWLRPSVDRNLQKKYVLGRRGTWMGDMVAPVWRSQKQLPHRLLHFPHHYRRRHLRRKIKIVMNNMGNNMNIICDQRSNTESSL